MEKLQKELFIGFDMQQVHCLGCNWTNNGCMFLHHSSDILISSIDAVPNITNWKTISNVQITSHSIATKATYLKLVMSPMVHLKDKIDPTQVPLALINISDDVIEIAKHIVM